MLGWRVLVESESNGQGKQLPLESVDYHFRSADRPRLACDCSGSGLLCKNSVRTVKFRNSIMNTSLVSRFVRHARLSARALNHHEGQTPPS